MLKNRVPVLSTNSKRAADAATLPNDGFNYLRLTAEPPPVIAVQDS
jgi:hypothetical protein